MTRIPHTEFHSALVVLAFTLLLAVGGSAVVAAVGCATSKPAMKCFCNGESAVCECAKCPCCGVKPCGRFLGDDGDYCNVHLQTALGPNHEDGCRFAEPLDMDSVENPPITRPEGTPGEVALAILRERIGDKYGTSLCYDYEVHLDLSYEVPRKELLEALEQVKPDLPDGVTVHVQTIPEAIEDRQAIIQFMQNVQQFFRSQLEDAE